MRSREQWRHGDFFELTNQLNEGYISLRLQEMSLVTTAASTTLSTSSKSMAQACISSNILINQLQSRLSGFFHQVYLPNFEPTLVDFCIKNYLLSKPELL